MTSAPFSSLVKDYLDERYEESPTWASMLGLTAYDERSEDLSAEAFRRREAAVRDWTKRLAAIPDDGLSPDERIDRDVILASLRGRELTQPRLEWKRQPNTYLNPSLGGVFTLFLHRLRPERDLAEAARARLLGVTRQVADGKANLDFALVPRIYVDRAIGQAKAAARYALELVPQEVKDPTLRQKVAEAGATAAGSFEDFAAFLETNKARAAGDYAIGEELYTALLREKELLPYGVRELQARGREQYDLLSNEANRIAGQINGGGTWTEVCERLNRVHAPTPDAMRAEYEEWTERARSFLADTGLVTLPPGERCTVEPSPHYQRPIQAVASYNQPPAFSDSLHGHFFVPYPPDGTPPDEVQKRLEGNCSAGIPTTAVHEAYPGHHWHLVMAKQNRSSIRRTHFTSYFAEGWGLYAERVMREQGFFSDPRHLLFQYEATLFRAARIVVDTALHMNEMTFDEAVDFMVKNGNLTPPNAKAEVGRYCSWPTQASSYLTGMLEIIDIRTRWLAKRGSADRGALRAFHDAITSTGSIPTSLAERAIAS
ncbi:MAG: DUF885 domain-containing protein [Chloroflexi bacterium]|nr:MAG: DUF885 domain-containing protein [Chloroflexota bacterium]TMG63581.1 MAG: DUF885 domain-containing protein [Chloroflexota bacterium]